MPKLEDYIKHRLQEANIDIELYIKIQNYELIKHICKCEKINNDRQQELFQKYIRPHIPVRERPKVIIEKIEEYEQTLCHILNGYDISVRQKQEKINEIIKNIESPDMLLIKTMLDYILVSKDNSTILLDNEMDIDGMFQETFKKVFNEKITNKEALKVKKCRLRKKILNKENPNNQSRKDYEFIMFKYIMDMSYDISF